MTKIGFTIEQRIAELTNVDKKAKNQENLDSFFARLTDLEAFKPEDPKNRASPRIKILIKNLLDNKASKWAKSREEKRIQTKDEVAKAVLKQD